MRTHRIRPLTAEDRWALRVYREAFPASERFPWALVHAACLRPGVDLVAWYDDERTRAVESGRATRPSALTWTLRRPGEGILYLFYFAVDAEARGRGVGSRVLAELRLRFPGATTALDIEPVVPEAPNAEERRHRLAFYERAGFRDTGLVSTDATGDYWTLAREEDGMPFDRDALLDAWGLLPSRLLGGVELHDRRGA